MKDLATVNADAEALYERLWVFAQRIYETHLEKGTTAHKDGWATLDERYQMQYFEKAAAFYSVGVTMYGDAFAHEKLL